MHRDCNFVKFNLLTKIFIFLKDGFCRQFVIHFSYPLHKVFSVFKNHLWKHMFCTFIRRLGFCLRHETAACRCYFDHKQYAKSTNSPQAARYVVLNKWLQSGLIPLLRRKRRILNPPHE